MRAEIVYPGAGEAYFGQDAQYEGHQPAYRDNGDGTVTDLNTGLMWQADPGQKMTYPQAVRRASACRVGGYADWRLPTIKELYSLILFSGTDPDPRSTDIANTVPFIATSVFKFQYGDTGKGERIIDSQFASSTKYTSTTMRGDETVFGVNFADGRIKGYGLRSPRGGAKTFHVLYVRGNVNYGRNDFKDNGDGTVTDRATGLTWMKVDGGKSMDWPAALAYAESLELAGHSDWRLPNAKELQSIVDYTRSPDTTHSAALDPVFEATPITNERGECDFAQYWTSTSHVRAGRGAPAAAYVAFGRAMGYMTNRRTGEGSWMDVHGAGAQRSDPKVGDASDYPTGRGPQGDAIRIENMVRCVRGGEAEPRSAGPTVITEPAIAEREGRQEQRREARRDNRRGPGRRGRRPPSGGDFVQRLDRDRDGRVSRGEFDGPAEHFDQFDRNGDGYISKDEAPQGPPPRP